MIRTQNFVLLAPFTSFLTYATDQRMNNASGILGEVQAVRQMIDGVERRLAHRPRHVRRVEKSHHGRQHQMDVVVQGGAEVFQGGQHLVRDLAVLARVVGQHAQDVGDQLGQVHLRPQSGQNENQFLAINM